jgi:hypothetical protein
LNLAIIDGSMAGVSGDKLLSAFVNAGIDPEIMQAELSKVLVAAGIPEAGFVKFEGAESRGINGLRLITKLDESTMGVEELTAALDRAAEALRISDWGRGIIRKAMEELVRGEKEVHGSAHLHEIGEADTLVDLVGTVRAVELLGLGGASFYTTPLAVGCGSIKSHHGLLPVPAPATTKILMRGGVPIHSTDKVGELTTPTGAALVAALTCGRHEPPPAVMSKEGIGIGTYEFAFPNITRVLAGTRVEERVTEEPMEQIRIIETNVDDVSGEILGWLQERLQGYAEDIAIFPMVTKKSRPGFCIRVVVMPDFLDEVRDILVRETGTLGVKIFECQRYRVPRTERTLDFIVGKGTHAVRIKSSEDGKRIKPEFEDLKHIAKEEAMPLREVAETVMDQIRQKYGRGEISNEG